MADSRTKHNLLLYKCASEKSFVEMKIIIMIHNDSTQSRALRVGEPNTCTLSRIMKNRMAIFVCSTSIQFSANLSHQSLIVLSPYFSNLVVQHQLSPFPTRKTVNSSLWAFLNSHEVVSGIQRWGR